jgi:putative flippase GtrA
MNKKQKRRKLELVQIVEYFVSGGAYFWSGYFIIVFLTPVIGLWWANLLGNGVGVTINFILERNWVFKGSKKRQLTEVSGKYIFYTVCNFLLNYVILRALLKVNVPVAIGQFIAAAFFTVWNYFWYRNWVFKGKTVKRRVHHHA